MGWKKLSEKYLFDDPPWLKIREDKLMAPNGNIKESYYVFEYPDWANTIALTTDGKFVMVRQYRHGIGKSSYELSAGVCEKGETPLVSAQRELLEETGYSGGNWSHWMSNSANPSTHDNLVHCYIATNVVKTHDQNLDPTEDISVHLLTFGEVLELLKNDKIIQALHASALWKYVALKQN